MNPPEDVSQVVLRVARALEASHVDYMVGGSVASSVYGDPRATQDIDVAVRLSSLTMGGFIKALGVDFIVDEEMLAEAVRLRRSANVFYLPLFTKIDLFIRGRDEYDEVEFSRQSKIEVAPGERVSASSVEDNLLWKLRWFRMGGEVSDQQWRDILGLLRVSGGNLDLSYLREWASRHKVSDLLDRALAQQPVA